MFKIQLGDNKKVLECSNIFLEYHNIFYLFLIVNNIINFLKTVN